MKQDGIGDLTVGDISGLRIHLLIGYNKTQKDGTTKSLLLSAIQ
jgi:hypothetical protein